MKKYLPLLAVAGLVLLISKANAYENHDDEIVEKLTEFFQQVQIPLPNTPFAQYCKVYVNGPFFWDYLGDAGDDLDYSIVYSVEGSKKFNMSYDYFDTHIDDYFSYGQKIRVYVTVRVGNDPDKIRYSLNYYINETKEKYNIKEETENRIFGYQITISDWSDSEDGYAQYSRKYSFQIIEKFDAGNYTGFVKVTTDVDAGTNMFKIETKYHRNFVYEINPSSLPPSDYECLNIYNEFASQITQNVKEIVQQVVGHKEEKEQKEKKETINVGNMSVYLEYYFDISKGKPLITYWEDGIVYCGSKKYTLYYNVTVEHIATKTKKYIHIGFHNGKINLEELFDTDLVFITDDGRFKITLDVQTDDSKYFDRVNDASFIPNVAVIECNVDIDDEGNITKVMVEKARNCWIKTGGKWEILWSKGGYKQVDGTNGFEVMVRSVPAWEKRVKYYIYKFLVDSNFYTNVKKAYNFGLAKIDSIPIYYERQKDGYDPNLDIINVSKPAGNVYRYNSDDFDMLFHEFGHAIKYLVYHYVDKDVEDYIGGKHGSTCDVKNIYFAFEEGHSEFFASLMVDYVKEKGYIEDVFFAPTNYYTTSCHFGKEGDKVEGAVAGLLLNALYKDYTESPEKAYEIFAKASELCNKYLKHYPYSIRDIIPFIIAVAPNSEPHIDFWDSFKNGGYNCASWMHVNNKPSKTDGLFGYPVLVAVEPSWTTKATIYSGGREYEVEEPDYGASDVDDGMACLIFIEPNTEIEADFSPGDGVYVILFDLNGNSMEEILSMKYGWFDDALIEFEKDGIKVLKGSVVVKSNSGTTYYAGSKIKIIPHSEFLLTVKNESAELYVMNGSVAINNGIENESVEKGRKAIANEEEIKISKYKSKELDGIWDNFEDAMKTVGIEKEKGGGTSRQPGFGAFIAIAAIILAIFLKRKK